MPRLGKKNYVKQIYQNKCFEFKTDSIVAISILSIFTLK